jgi:hypothetical protein
MSESYNGSWKSGTDRANLGQTSPTQQPNQSWQSHVTEKTAYDHAISQQKKS